MSRNSIRNNRGIPTIRTRTLWRRAVSSARNIHDEPGIACHTKKQKGYQKLLGLCHKDLGANLKRFELSKGGIIWASKSYNCNGLKHIKINTFKTHLKFMSSFIYYFKKTCLFLEVTRGSIHCFELVNKRKDSGINSVFPVQTICLRITRSLVKKGQDFLDRNMSANILRRADKISPFHNP